MPPDTQRPTDTHLPDPIATCASESPEQVIIRSAVRSTDEPREIREWTAAAFDRWIHQVERRLVASAGAPGAPIGIFGPHSPATIALLWAIWRTGNIAVPLNTRQPPATAADQASRAGAHLLVSNDEDVIQAATEAGVQVCAFDSLTAPPPAEKSNSSMQEATERVFPEEATLRASLLPFDARATALFTSGSTGTPKIAVHTLGNHVYSARGSAENIPLLVGDQWLASLPLYHVGGLAILFRCAVAGATVAVPAEGMSVRDAIHVLRPTHVSLVATQLKQLLDAAEREARDGVPDQTVGQAVSSSLKALLLGGSAIPPGLLDAACKRNWPVHTSYGSTEMASQVTATPPNASRGMLKSSGRCLPHRTFSIRAPNGHEVKTGEAGEICVGGKTLFAGYVANEGADEVLNKPLTANEDFRTGDLGWIDRKGCLHVRGRADRLIISGGENIQPEEVEAAIEQCDGVVRAAVVGIPDDKFGQRPVAFVEWKAEPRDLDTDLRKKLAGYKLPKAVYQMPDDAVHPNIKVNYERLQSAARKLPR